MNPKLSNSQSQIEQLLIDSVFPFSHIPENDYQQDKCEGVIERMLDCCEQNMKENYFSCDGFKFQLAKRQKARASSNNKQ